MGPLLTWREVNGVPIYGCIFRGVTDLCVCLKIESFKPLEDSGLEFPHIIIGVSK